MSVDTMRDGHATGEEIFLIRCLVISYHYWKPLSVLWKNLIYFIFILPSGSARSSCSCCVARDLGFFAISIPGIKRKNTGVRRQETGDHVQKSAKSASIGGSLRERASEFPARPLTGTALSAVNFNHSLCKRFNLDCAGGFCRFFKHFEN